MRCFVAVAVGADITERLSAVYSALRSAAERCGVRISWSAPEGWHATLKFLGEIDEDRLQSVRSRLSGLTGLEAFMVEASGLITLPAGARVPNVIAVGLSDDGRFTRLASAVEDVLAADGFERETRRFVPHLTLGRVRAPRGWRRFAPELVALARQSFGTGQVREMTLFRSHRGNGPARYEALETIALGSAGRTSDDVPSCAGESRE